MFPPNLYTFPGCMSENKEQTCIVRLLFASNVFRSTANFTLLQSATSHVLPANNRKSHCLLRSHTELLMIKLEGLQLSFCTRYSHCSQLIKAVLSVAIKFVKRERNSNTTCSHNNLKAKTESELTRAGKS